MRKGGTLVGIAKILFTAWFSVCLTVNAQNPVEKLRQTELAFAASVFNRERTKFEQFLSEEAIFLSSTVLKGKEAVMAAWAPFFQQDGPELRWEPTEVEVLSSGDLGITKGPYTLEAKQEDGTTVSSQGTFTSVWKRTPEGWKIVFDSGCSCP